MFREFAVINPRRGVCIRWINVLNIDSIEETLSIGIWNKTENRSVSYPCVIARMAGGEKIYLNGTLDEILQRLPAA